MGFRGRGSRYRGLLDCVATEVSDCCRRRIVVERTGLALESLLYSFNMYHLSSLILFLTLIFTLIFTITTNHIASASTQYELTPHHYHRAFKDKKASGEAGDVLGSEFNNKQRLERIQIMGEQELERKARMTLEDEQHEIFSNHYLYARQDGSCSCPGCTLRMNREKHERDLAYKPPTAVEYAQYLQWRAEEAEQRSKAAAEKRLEEQNQERMEREQERLRKEQEKTDRVKRAEERKRAAKTKVKEERSKETARQASKQQEKDAQVRMARHHIKEQHAKFDKYLRDMKNHGQEVETRTGVVDIGWVKKKGVATCLFCEEEIKYYSFRCPDGGAVACNPCKNKLSQVLTTKVL
ncbi:hypothetical protein P153DRAFT_361045 [Dothidotthia symphoricarpi CBS 119687]|uniref:Uncharacterized protein n=1 Tax=Dothidotthia symphoricarpi CBS 119687 TaxID=1392245 RepID=A0A6A5ZYQ8_9PLEO|nr:uncharacterized protein P153DRAFT_361045 [Dothidotthia symphoricarpi CBS 119687]KAF2124882.1 hypothetical protein P153DRAFT_361045 [Dothidotthia symphoricarpi CBS 119687]